MSALYFGSIKAALHHTAGQAKALGQPITAYIQPLGFAPTHKVVMNPDGYYYVTGLGNFAGDDFDGNHNDNA
jgi:hypothetical protein